VTVEEALASVAEADKWAIELSHIKDNGNSLAAAILRGNARAVSDGSLKKFYGNLLVNSIPLPLYQS
jgi:hypothetical protein